MGYTGAMGTMLMDEIAGVCARAEGRFTRIRTDLGKIETEIGKAQDWLSRVQDKVDGLERLVWQLLAS